MNAVETLLSRRSIPAQCLTDPGPDERQLAVAFDAVMRAPDHGRMQPWRFKLIRGAARSRFSDVLVAAALAHDPATPQRQIDKIRSRAQHAPLVIVVSARYRDNPKVPEVEQTLSVGAAVMNLLNALHAQGLGAVLLTGPSTYDPAVASALGYGGEERLIGFIYVGTIGLVVPAAPERSAHANVVSELADHD
jgi:nitroreductase